MNKKICVFGDSIAKGIIIDSAHNRYITTKRSFANILSQRSSWLNIKNYSMLGCTIEKGLSLIKRHMASVQNCDVMVLEYGGNDSDHNWDEIASDPDAPHLPKTPIDIFTDDYLHIIQGLSDMGKKIVILNLPPIDEKKYFNWISNGLNGENILKWLGGTERTIFDFHANYNKHICSIAKEYGIPLVDIRSAFLSAGDYSRLLCDDGIHPNEQGHALIAETISEELPRLFMTLSLFPTA